MIPKTKKRSAVIQNDPVTLSEKTVPIPIKKKWNIKIFIVTPTINKTPGEFYCICDFISANNMEIEPTLNTKKTVNSSR